MEKNKPFFLRNGKERNVQNGKDRAPIPGTNTIFFTGVLVLYFKIGSQLSQLSSTTVHKFRYPT